MLKTVLVVDDDRDIARLITDGLEYEQYRVQTADSGAEALLLLDREQIDYVILDIMMPEMDGMELCRHIRRKAEVPIMFLSAKDRVIDKVIGLEIGADDYMTKPFSMQELTSRVKAHFRKEERLYANWSERQRDIGAQRQERRTTALELNETTYEAFLHGQRLDLSTKEFQILLYFDRHPNQVLTREQIYEHVWGDDFGEINTVTVHIKNIRKKLGKQFDAVRTIWGVGYKYAVEGHQE